MALDYFNSVSDALEIKARTQSINEKITYAAELQSVLRQLLTEVGVQLCQHFYHRNLMFRRHLLQGWS